MGFYKCAAPLQNTWLEKKYLINVGSIGQPRDGDARAAYALYDLEKNEIQLRRVPYDVAAAQEKIRKAGLPERLAARLAIGRWEAIEWFSDWVI